MLGFSVVVLGVQVFARYGWGLFVGVPFSMGLFAALVHGYRTPRGLGECLGVSLLAPLLLAALLLGLAVEGLVCIAMAGPLCGPVVGVRWARGLSHAEEGRRKSHRRPWWRSRSSHLS